MRHVLPIALVTAALLAGCGSSGAPTAPPELTRSVKATAVVGGPSTFDAQGVPQPQRPATAADTSKAYAGGQTSTTATGAGASGASAGGSKANVTTTGELEAEIVEMKNGSLLGMGKFVATVHVTNPTDERLTGVVTVSFLNNGSPSKTAPIERPVDLPANGEMTFEAIDPKWSTDEAEVEVTTHHTAQTKLAAAVISKKNGIVFGMGKFKASIEVSNPTSTQKTNTIVVTFTNKGEPAKGSPISEEITLEPGETITKDYEDKNWSTDDVEVSVE